MGTDAIDTASLFPLFAGASSAAGLAMIPLASSPWLQAAGYAYVTGMAIAMIRVADEE